MRRSLRGVCLVALLCAGVAHADNPIEPEPGWPWCDLYAFAWLSFGLAFGGLDSPIWDYNRNGNVDGGDFGHFGGRQITGCQEVMVRWRSAGEYDQVEIWSMREPGLEIFEGMLEDDGLLILQDAPGRMLKVRSVGIRGEVRVPSAWTTGQVDVR